MKKLVQNLGKMFGCVLFAIGILTVLYYGMGKELERREAEFQWYVERCQQDDNYYPEFCQHILEQNKIRMKG